jgi:hypothetical protein
MSHANSSPIFPGKSTNACGKTSRKRKQNMSDNNTSSDAANAIADAVIEAQTPANRILPINRDPYANPIDTIRRMRQYSQCFTKAFDRGQRVFVLVEQDATAYKAIAQWINLNIDRLGANHPKIIAAKTTMMIFMEGHNNLNKKLPD